MPELLLAFMSFGFTELMLVGIVALLVFGGELPDVMHNLGRTYKKFRQGLQDMSKPVREEVIRARKTLNEATSLSDKPNAGKSSADRSSSSKPAAAPTANADEAPMPYVAPAPTSDTSPGSVWDNLDEPPPV